MRLNKLFNKTTRIECHEYTVLDFMKTIVNFSHIVREGIQIIARCNPYRGQCERNDGLRPSDGNEYSVLLPIHPAALDDVKSRELHCSSRKPER